MARWNGELILELTGSKSELRFLPARADDPLQRDPDISLAKAKLGWQPKTPPREGMKKAVDYFDRWLKENSDGKQ